MVSGVVKCNVAIYKSTWMWDGKSDMPAHGWAGISPALTGDRYRQFARAAITALREPTEAMVKAGGLGIWDFESAGYPNISGISDGQSDIGEAEEIATKAWRAMIEAAYPRETSSG